jgi:PAS domain S-box-containing protein
LNNPHESREQRSTESPGAYATSREPPGESWFVDIRERVAAQLGRRFSPPPEPPAPAPDGPPAQAKLPESSSRLSTAERSAFREIARALGARFEPDAGGPDDRADGLPIEDPPPVEAHEAEVMAGTAPVARPLAGTGSVLERLPLAALVHRDERVLFANRLLLDLAGYDSIDDLAAEGGTGRLLGGSLPLAPAGGLTPLTLATRHGSLPVEAQVATIDWEGEPAGLVLLGQTPQADLAARLEAAERELASRDARLRELEEERARAVEQEAAHAAALARVRDLETAEAERSARARELEAILDTATDGVVVTDETGRILSLNRSAEALFGYEAAEVVGDAITVLLAPESHIVALTYLERLRSSGMDRALNDGREVAGRVRQGGSIPLFMTMGPVQDGPHPRVCAVLRDITAFKKAEAELTEAKRAAEAANAQQSDVLAKISHEIRTPLNAIIGFAEVMLEERFGPVGNERYKEYLRDVHASGSHVISLVNDLLDLAKIEAGRMDLSFTGVSLNALAQACVALLQPQASRERIVMRTSFAQRLPSVVADERSLRQIALNLVSNAIKFTDAGGQVIVSTALTDRGEVALRVRDTGLGMSETEIAAALEPFRQLNTTRKRGGSGLGLPLTKALVEANSGAMQITSHPGEGTLVEVLFPHSRVMAD